MVHLVFRTLEAIISFYCIRMQFTSPPPLLFTLIQWVFRWYYPRGDVDLLFYPKWHRIGKNSIITGEHKVLP